MSSRFSVSFAENNGSTLNIQTKSVQSLMPHWNYGSHRLLLNEAFWGNVAERTCHRTNGWYEYYQALVRPVPAFGMGRTKGWYQFNITVSLWLYDAIGLLIAAFRESSTSIYKGVLTFFLLFWIRQIHVIYIIMASMLMTIKYLVHKKICVELIWIEP